MDTASRRLSPLVISSVVVIGFVAVIVLLIARPVQLSADVVSLLNILLGVLAAQFANVVQFYLGSSAGSKDKDEMAKALILAKGPPPA